MIDKQYLIAKGNTFKKALSTLQEAIEMSNQTDLQRDGAIQRFEYCFELAWKIVKLVIEYEGHETTGSPREVLVLGTKLKIVDDEADWFRMLLERNNSVHTYRQELAAEIASNLKLNYEIMNRLSEKITKRYQ